MYKRWSKCGLFAAATIYTLTSWSSRYEYIGLGTLQVNSLVSLSQLLHASFLQTFQTKVIIVDCAQCGFISVYQLLSKSGVQINEHVHFNEGSKSALQQMTVLFTVHKPCSAVSLLTVCPP